MREGGRGVRGLEELWGGAVECVGGRYAVGQEMINQDTYWR